MWPAVALICALALSPFGAAEAASPPKRDLSVMTLKERSSRKAMDPQRVNDCKVPENQRGDRNRPSDCATTIRKQDPE